jgi:hypothetical protein
VKAGELIIGVFPNVRCKGGHRAGIASFQLGKRLEITLRREIFVLLGSKGLTSAQSFRPTPQNKVPDRSAPELFYPRRQRCTDTYAGAELLVGSFEPRRNVYSVAIGCVVEEATAAEITDERQPGMNTDPCDSQRDGLFAPALAKLLCVLV